MNKLEKKSILIGFFIAIILFIAMIFSILLYIYPNIQDIEQKKIIFNKNFEKLETLKKDVISFKEFSKLKNSNDIVKDNNSTSVSLKKIYEYFKNIKIDEFFYNQTLIGEEEFTDVDRFFKDKESKLDNLLKSNSVKEKEEKLYKILPIYSQFIELNNDNFLTNLKFVNYLEQLLYKHNIQNKTAIGIKNIVSLDKANIYYIPITLDIEAKKGDLINLINDINNSGRVVLGSCNSLDNNKKIFNEKQKELNICNNNQITEIESLELKSYIDNNSAKRDFNDSNLKDFLSSTQQLNKFIKGNLKLMFFINTLKKDSIIASINEIIGNNRIKNYYDNKGNIDKKIIISYNFINLKKKTTELLKNPKVKYNVFYYNKVLNIQKNLLSVEKNINNLKKQINKVKNLDNIYRQVLNYKDSFLKANRELDNIITNLGLKTNKDSKLNNKKQGITKK